jgi:AraC-like DNA-binding protein
LLNGGVDMPKAVKELRDTRFANERLDAVGLELLTVSQLRQRVPLPLLCEAERVEFCMLMVVSRGSGEHMLDFTRMPLKPGRVVFVRPGQVQEWRPQSGYEADVLLIEPAVLHPAAMTLQQSALALLRLEDWPSRFDLDAAAFAAFRSLARQLRHELDQPFLDAVSAALARQLLLCVMLGMSRFAMQESADPSEQLLLARRFQRELDALVSVRPSVELLARRLGVSTSTLSRTCSNALGRTAKALVDQRVALEAQRLLVHSTASSVAIGERLGFSEPTNFVKFFRRLVGTTPEAFRRAHRLQ